MSRVSALAWAIAVASPSFAQETARISTLAGDSVPVSRVSSEDGKTVVAALVGGGSRSLALDEIESIAWPSSGRSSPPASGFDGRIWLRSGLMLRGAVRGGDLRSVRVDTQFGDGLEFPWIRVRAICNEALSGDDAALFDAALTAPLDTQDILLARDRQSGKITRLSLHVLGLGDAGLRVDFRGERDVPLAQVVCIVFGRENGAPPPELPLPLVTLQPAEKVTDQSLGSGQLESLTDDTVGVKLADGPSLRVPRPLLTGVLVRSSRVAWLSSMEPGRLEQTAALDTSPVFLRDAAPCGPGLVLGPRKFTRGLCMVPRTRVEFDIGQQGFDVFDATIGIDARSTGPADAVFRVLLDGKIAWQREHVTAAVIEEIHVPLDAAKRLSLEVDFGDNFDLGDHCVFAGARLLKR